jgi:hypothetical protein
VGRWVADRLAAVAGGPDVPAERRTGPTRPQVAS